MKQMIYKNVSLKEMLEDLVKLKLEDDSATDNTYYWKNDDGQFVEIEQVDLLRDRFCTVDGDFNYYEYELENNRIYIKEEVEYSE